MKNLNDIRADILAAMQAAAEPESRNLNKSDDQVLADAIANYLATPTTSASEPTKKQKGIAITHMALQGGAANNRNVPLLMKKAKPGFSMDVNKSVMLTPEDLLSLEKLGYKMGKWIQSS